jgi:hypothetical protein
VDQQGAGGGVAGKPNFTTQVLVVIKEKNSYLRVVSQKMI